MRSLSTSSGWAYTGGVLPQFLIASALGPTETRRKGWDELDLLTASGIHVEVKASDYLQGSAKLRPRS